MNLKDLVAVSGLAGIYRMVTTRANGIIIADLDSGKNKFASSRKHQFTPLESIAIYTNADSVELRIVFERMLNQMESNPPVSASSPVDELNAYFAGIVPDYDRFRVHNSDIKKVIKWFRFLHERGALRSDAASEEE